MMSQLTNRRAQSQTLRYLVGLLCVLLILFVGAAQTLHVHAQDEAANPGCSLCAVAHATALPAPVPAGLMVAEAVVAVSHPPPAWAPKSCFSFNLYVRPPPALTAHA